MEAVSSWAIITWVDRPVGFLGAKNTSCASKKNIITTIIATNVSAMNHNPLPHPARAWNSGNVIVRSEINSVLPGPTGPRTEPRRKNSANKSVHTYKLLSTHHLLVHTGYVQHRG